MPRSIQEILDHAELLAKRFEDYEPDPSDERPVEEYLLERAALTRARSERQIVDAVTAGGAKNVSWQRIGELLGTSGQAAQQRYGAVVEAGRYRSGPPEQQVPSEDGCPAPHPGRCRTIGRQVGRRSRS